MTLHDIRMAFATGQSVMIRSIGGTIETATHNIHRVDWSKEAGTDIAVSVGETSSAAKPEPVAVATHSTDFTSVSWHGAEYSFALGVQSAAVKALWAEWKTSGLGLHQGTICKAVDAERDTFRMDKAFRNHPALGTMIQSIGDGRYKLVEPIAKPPKEATKKNPARIPAKARQKPR